jgi:hypothetical protein
MSCRAARSSHYRLTGMVTCPGCGLPDPDIRPGLTAPQLCPACRVHDRTGTRTTEFRDDRMRPSVITVPVLTILILLLWWIVLRGGITN